MPAFRTSPISVKLINPKNRINIFAVANDVFTIHLFVAPVFTHVDPEFGSQDGGTNVDMRHIQYQGETLPLPPSPGISVSPGIR